MDTQNSLTTWSGGCCSYTQPTGTTYQYAVSQFQESFRVCPCVFMFVQVTAYSSAESPRSTPITFQVPSYGGFVAAALLCVFSVAVCAQNPSFATCRGQRPSIAITYTGITNVTLSIGAVYMYFCSPSYCGNLQVVLYPAGDPVSTLLCFCLCSPCSFSACRHVPWDRDCNDERKHIHSAEPQAWNHIRLPGVHACFPQCCCLTCVCRSFN